MDEKKMNQAPALSAEAIAARREYRARWREKNRERIREYDRQYWERRAAEAKIEQQKEADKQ